MGLFFAGMAVLQAWPGRGFWAGSQHGAPGTLTGMVRSMAGTSQPAVFAHWVSGFGNFTAAHGFAVNLVVVIALGAIGAGLLSGQPRLLRPAIAAATVLCLADWVLIEDFGFFGGLGTDPNSMIPILLIVYTGYLALTRVPAPARGGRPGRRPGPGHAAARPRPAQTRPRPPPQTRPRPRQRLPRQTPPGHARGPAGATACSPRAWPGRSGRPAPGPC